jgi:uncharacterized protein (DUF2267 family)
MVSEQPRLGCPSLEVSGIRQRTNHVSGRKWNFMKGEQFSAEVRNLAELDTNEDAEKAIRVTLETLKEQLAGNEPSNLATQLPPEIAPYVEGNGGERTSPCKSSMSE